MPRKPAKPKVVPLFKRAEVIGLCRRFLKEDTFTEKWYDPIQSPMTLYMLLKRYPSRPFWENLELGFQLRSLNWFLGGRGKEELDKRWSIYTLDMGPQVVHTLETEKVGADVVVTRPKVSVADILS